MLAPYDGPDSRTVFASRAVNRIIETIIEKNFDGVSVTKPDGTYMLWVDCGQWCRDHGRDLQAVEEACWKVGAAVQDGRMFHGPSHLRMNLALPYSRVTEAFERMRKYVF